MKRFLYPLTCLIFISSLEATTLAWNSDFVERSYNDRCEDLDSTFITNVGRCEVRYSHDRELDPDSFRYCFSVTYRQLLKSYDSFTDPNGRTMTWSNRAARHWTTEYCTDKTAIYNAEGPSLAQLCRNWRRDAFDLMKSSNSPSRRKAACE